MVRFFFNYELLEKVTKTPKNNDSAVYVLIYFKHTYSKTVTDLFKRKYIPRLGATCMNGEATIVQLSLRLRGIEFSLVSD